MFPDNVELCDLNYEARFCYNFLISFRKFRRSLAIQFSIRSQKEPRGEGIPGGLWGPLLTPGARALERKPGTQPSLLQEGCRCTNGHRSCHRTHYSAKCKSLPFHRQSEWSGYVPAPLPHRHPEETWLPWPRRTPPGPRASELEARKPHPHRVPRSAIC